MTAHRILGSIMTPQKIRHFPVPLRQNHRPSALASSKSYNRSLKISTIGAAISALTILFPTQAFGITLVTSRAALGETDRVDWSSVGPIVPPAPFKTLPYNFSTTSVQGLGVNVNVPVPVFTGPPTITPPLLFQTSATGIPTNFADGDFVLFTGLKPGPAPAIGNPGPLTITFNSPVSAVGTQIAADDATTPYTVNIFAYDLSNTLLGNFTIGGTSSLALDNSAQFLGVSSDVANISKIVYSTSESNRAFGINALSIAQPVPEPLTIFGTIVGGAAAWKMKKKIKSIDKV
jgi:hypothetical protein